MNQPDQQQPTQKSRQRQQIIVNNKNLISQFDLAYKKQSHKIINVIVKYKVIIPLQSFRNQTPLEEVQLKLSKCFYMCQFDRLQSLFLSHGDLTTFQFLSFIDAPVLMNLAVQYNKAIRTKSLNKQVMQKLGSLDFEKNPCHEFSIQRLKLSKMVRMITLDLQNMDWMINHNYRHITNQDLSKLVKIEPETVNLLQIKRNGRIIQSRVESILHERFSSHLFKLELK